MSKGQQLTPYALSYLPSGVFHKHVPHLYINDKRPVVSTTHRPSIPTVKDVLNSMYKGKTSPFFVLFLNKDDLIIPVKSLEDNLDQPYKIQEMTIDEYQHKFNVTLNCTVCNITNFRPVSLLFQYGTTTSKEIFESPFIALYFLVMFRNTHTTISHQTITATIGQGYTDSDWSIFTS